MAIKGSGSPMEAVDEYFDMLIKSRFIEMFEDQNYQLIRLGDILKQNTTVTKVDCPDKETFVTLSSKGRGAKKREIKDGKTPVAFSGYRIHAGQFIYSRIDARNAAFDIVPECLEGAVVSKDFPVFDFDTNAIEPVYLLHSVLQNSFIEQIQSSSFGATNRQRIKEETMMNYSIVLPPLSKQREYSQFVQLTIIIKKHYQQLMDSFDILVKSRFIEMFGAVDNPKVPFEQLGNIATYVNGYAFKPSDWGTKGLPIIRIQNLSGSGDSFNYYSGTYPPAIEINKGDIMISWSATLGVFVWDGPKALLNQHIFKVYFDKLEVNPTYIRVAVEPALERSASKVHGSTMTHLTKKTFDSIMVPLPSIDQQNEFASFVHQVDKSKFEVVQSLLRLKSKYMHTETPSERTD